MLRESYANSKVTLFRRFLRADPATTCSVILCLILATPLRGQERVRTSAGPLAIQTFKRAPEVFFRLGPFDGDVTASSGVEYTDNATLTSTDKTSRLRFDEGLSLDLTWVVSHLSELEIQFGGQLTEDFYENGKKLANFDIEPSTIQYKFSISYVRIRLYDTFSYTNDPTLDPTVTNISYLHNLTNTVGASADTDLGIAILSLSADFTYSDSSGSSIQNGPIVQNSATQANITGTTGTRESTRVGCRLSFPLTTSILYGIDTSASRSSGSNAANVNSLSGGPFIAGRVGPALDFNLSGGINLLDTKPSVPPGYFFSGVIRHQTTRNLQVILSADHDLIFTTGTDLTQATDLRISALLKLTRFISVSASPFYEFGSVKTGVNPGDYSQYGVELSLGWTPRKRWHAALTYELVRHEQSGSNGTTNVTFNGTSSSGNYTQNTFGFHIGYTF
jgi:hypothetical protein